MDTLDLPRPLRSAAPLAVLAVAAAGTDADPRLSWLVGALGAACFAAAAGLHALRARLELAAVRRTADRLIVASPAGRDASELVRWRSAELTAENARRALRKELQRVLRELDGRLLPGASPLRRSAARANVELLRRVEARVGDGRPCTARGLLLVRGLLRDPASPLYAEDADLVLPRALHRLLGALEP